MASANLQRGAVSTEHCGLSAIANYGTLGEIALGRSARALLPFREGKAMTRFLLLAGSLGIVLGMLGTSRIAAEDGSARGDQPSLNDLSMEVAALDLFHQLKLTPAQLQAVRRLAKETVAEPSTRATAKASAAYRRTLANLRDALVEEDDELVDQLQLELDDLIEKEKPDLDDGFEVTNGARTRATELFRLLSPRQVAYYLANHVDTIPEPLEWILQALEQVRDLDAQKWKELREAIPDEVSRGVAGLDADKASQVTDRVVQLLIQARALKDEEFKAERPELEKMAREIVGDLSPFDVLRQVIVQDLAELLSNPRLEAAVAARLKK